MENLNYAGDKEIVINYFEGGVASLSTSILRYCNKAKKENELQIANAKYKTRFELAQKIFAANGNTLDKESIALVRELISDKDVTVQQDESTIQHNYLVNDLFSSLNINSNESGVG